jgi:glutamyl-tRNA reductase
VPRDIDPEAHRLDNVYLYDIDDLQGVVALNRAQRGGELERVQSIIEDEVTAWEGWYRGRAAQPLLAALAQHAETVRDAEVEAALAQLPHLAERERAVIRALGRGITGKLMHPPLRYLREAGSSGAADDVEALRRAFALHGRDTDDAASTRSGQTDEAGAEEQQ